LQENKDIGPGLRYTQCIELLKNCSAFKSYQSFIRQEYAGWRSEDVEQKLADVVYAHLDELEEKDKAERRARSRQLQGQFLDLLQEAGKTGKLTANSQWRQVREEVWVTADPSFAALDESERVAVFDQVLWLPLYISPYS
jgi:hypothetical protein